MYLRASVLLAASAHAFLSPRGPPVQSLSPWLRGALAPRSLTQRASNGEPSYDGMDLGSSVATVAPAVADEEDVDDYLDEEEEEEE